MWKILQLLNWSLFFAVERIWVPFGVTAVLFLIGGVLPGRIFSKIPVTQVFRRYTEGKKGWKRPLLFIQFAGVAFYMWIDVCSDAPVSLCY